MEINNFVHLHVHSDNSLLDGYGTIDEYINKAKDLNMPALALTDHNTMTGIYDFIKKCKKNSIKPICGIEFNVAPLVKDEDNLKSRVSYDETRRNLIINGTHTHLTVLAKNKKGLLNLFKLLQQSYNKDKFFDVPRIKLTDLLSNKEGLIVLSGCPHSELNVRLGLNQPTKAKTYIEIMKKSFGDDFYIEIMDWQTAQSYRRDILEKIVAQLDLKGVITNDVHYLNKEDAPAQEKFMALKSNSKIHETPKNKGGMRPTLGDSERYFKDFSEMQEIFPLDKYYSYYSNIQEIVDKVELIDLEYDPSLRPRIELPQGFETDIEYFDYLIKEGFKKKRSSDSKEVQEESLKRIREERDVIYGNDFVQYFLVVRDYLKWSVDNGYPIGVGRGSVGGSEIAYLLDISNTDPIRFNLLFERFLSDGRGAIYEIEYEDGTKEEVLVNNKYKTKDGMKYTWQLNVNDEVDI